MLFCFGVSYPAVLAGGDHAYFEPFESTETIWDVLLFTSEPRLCILYFGAGLMGWDLAFACVEFYWQIFGPWSSHSRHGEEERALFHDPWADLKNWLKMGKCMASVKILLLQTVWLVCFGWPVWQDWHIYAERSYLVFHLFYTHERWIKQNERFCIVIIFSTSSEMWRNTE